MHFTNDELDMIEDALDMALQSNKRMQASKPKFAEIFRKIEADIQTLKIKLRTPIKQK